MKRLNSSKYKSEYLIYKLYTAIHKDRSAVSLIESCKKDYGKVIIILSASTGKKRAVCASGCGANVHDAWRKSLVKLKSISLDYSNIRHLRVDIVHSIKSGQSNEILDIAAKYRRNYFPYGISFDNEFETALLAEEIVGVGAFSFDKINRFISFNYKLIENYLRNSKQIKFAEGSLENNNPWYMFETFSLFCSADEQSTPVQTLIRSPYGGGSIRNVGELEAEIKRTVALAGNYLARQVRQNGSFVYGYFPTNNKVIATYNILRHSSTLYSMLEAWEITGDARIVENVSHGIDYVIRESMVIDGNCSFVVDRANGDEIKLGAQAAFILAVTKFAQMTGDNRYLNVARAVARGIVTRFMNTSTGRYVHVLDGNDFSVKDVFRIIYYDGEATLALLRLFEQDKNPLWRDSARSAFDNFIARDHWRNHDHWLSYCTNEITRYFPENIYFEFGLKNAFGNIKFMNDRDTAYPTFLELLMSTLDMYERVERSGNHELLKNYQKTDLIDTINTRLKHQRFSHFYPETAMFFLRPDIIHGSFFIRHHSCRVRIDDVEHFISGYCLYMKYVSRSAAGSEASSKLPEFSSIQGAPASFEADDRCPAWSESQVANAVNGEWVSPPRAGWMANGLCIYAPLMRPSNLVAARAPGEAVGVPYELAIRMIPRPAGIMATNPAALMVTGVPILKVDDIGEAVLSIGRVARNKMTGNILAVTGSSGKTTTAAMLSHVLLQYGYVGTSSHNANLPHGVAWNLASIPWDSPHVVLEIAVGRMGKSARMARPNVAIFTNILPAHLGEDGTIANIARTKSAIFSGMSPGDVAVLNRDMAEWEIVHEAAVNRGLRIVKYGSCCECDFQLVRYSAADQQVTARMLGREVQYRVGPAGLHMALNSLAVLAATSSLGHPIEPALARIETFSALPGRGEKLDLTVNGRRISVIDDAYNANPGSMKAGLERLGQEAPGRRRVAVLGQMEELGPRAEEYHVELAALIERYGIDRVYAMGTLFSGFWKQLAENRKGRLADSIAELEATLRDELAEGDVVMFKGSHSTGIHRLVSWIKRSSEGSETLSRPYLSPLPAPARPTALSSFSETPFVVPANVSALLYDAESECVVFSFGETISHPPASITKLMTLCLVQERLLETGGSLTEHTTVSATAAKVNSWWGFPAGARVDIETLMRACAIVSSNEAANALAEWHSGSVERFTALLNKKAKQLGMFYTHFSTPSGLGRDQKITVSDTLTLARYIFSHNKKIVEICGERSFNWNEKIYRNTNRLLGEFPEADGLKTGTLRTRGYNIVFSTTRKGKRWIAVVLGAPTASSRDESVRLLLNTYAAVD
jgi:UDP-N-acetylmuramoyl-tripeptide--D-alanyl-D-alanine ligase